MLINGLCYVPRTATTTLTATVVWSLQETTEKVFFLKVNNNLEVDPVFACATKFSTLTGAIDLGYQSQLHVVLY